VKLFELSGDLLWSNDPFFNVHKNGFFGVIFLEAVSGVSSQDIDGLLQIVFYGSIEK
jgi:hypothetical protein